MTGVLARNKRFVLAKESRGEGCGWVNYRQKEGMLIMYSCCEVSAGMCVCVDTALQKKMVKKNVISVTLFFCGVTT